MFYNKTLEGAMASNEMEIFSKLHPNFGIVVVDMQKQAIKYISREDRERVLKYQQETLSYAARNNIPTCIVETYDETGSFRLSPTVPQILSLVENIPRNTIVKKHLDEKNGFSNPNLNDFLAQQNIESLLFMGLFKSECVLSTARATPKNYTWQICEGGTADKKVTIVDRLAKKLIPDEVYDMF